MEMMVLGVIAAGCGAAAIYFWMASSRLKEEASAVEERANKTIAEARKTADRAEKISKKAGKHQADTSVADRALETARAKVAELHNETGRLATIEKKLSGELEHTGRDLRKATRRLEELEAMLSLRGGLEPEARRDDDDDEAPPVVVAAAPAVAVTSAADVEKQLRLENLVREREERSLEAERLRIERDRLRNEQMAKKDLDELAELRREKERWLEMLFERERNLRVESRKGRDNYRAYIITKGQLDLALDELYRRKHGRERPVLDEDGPVMGAADADGGDGKRQQRRESGRQERKPPHAAAAPEAVVAAPEAVAAAPEAVVAAPVEAVVAAPVEAVVAAPVEAAAAPVEAAAAPEAVEAAAADIETAADVAETVAGAATVAPAIGA